MYLFLAWTRSYPSHGSLADFERGHKYVRLTSGTTSLPARLSNHFQALINLYYGAHRLKCLAWKVGLPTYAVQLTQLLRMLCPKAAP